MATYVVVPGDTLAKIAGRYNTTVATLQELNGIADPNWIYPGQVLQIPGDDNGQPFRQLVTNAALQLLEEWRDVTYEMGAKYPENGYRKADCSGFVVAVLERCNVRLDSRPDQRNWVSAEHIRQKLVPIDRQAAEPGDVIFFTGTYVTDEPATHVGIWVGDNTMVDCNSRNGVGRTTLDSFWEAHYLGMGRVQPVGVEAPPEPGERHEKPAGVVTAMYLHQFAGGGRQYREQSYGEFAQTAKGHAIDQIWFKTHQGGRLSGAWDPSPLAFRSIDQVAECYEACRAHGVEAIGWFVPQGDTWQADAELAIAIGQRCGNKIHVDLECFPDFWNAPQCGVAGMEPFFRQMKEAGLSVEVSAVMRFYEPETIPWAAILPHIDLVWSQSYWTDFRKAGWVSAGQVVQEDIAVMQRLGAGDKFGVVLPHNGTRAELDEAWAVAQQYGVKGVAIWVWDWVGSATPFEFLRDLPHIQPTPEPEPQPAFDLVAALNGIWHAAQVAEEKAPTVSPEMNEIRRLVGEINSKVGKLG